MNCEEFQNRIGTARDGELDDAGRLELEAHLAECGECRDAAEGLDRLDALLRRSLRPMRRRAEELAARVTLELAAPRPRRASGHGSTWPRLAVAAAAGFLAAALVFQPWRSPARPQAVAPDLAGDPAPRPTDVAGPAERGPEASGSAVAQVLASTGPIDVRFPDQSEWVTVDAITPFMCPSDTCVKTPSGSLCELETSSGSVVRMRDETEVKVQTPDELELSGGHLWVRVPESRRLLVTANSATDTDEAAVRSEAVGPAVMMQCVNPDPLTVTSCSGWVDVGSGRQSTRLAAGGSVQLVNGTFVPSDPGAAPLLEEAWMHPLLMRYGHHNPELAARVDAMLARIGDMKLSLLYEQQIRGLGEYSALPLLRYIQTTPADVDAARRETAARILADIAPVWTVPDLIGLLSDDNPQIRSAGDRALARLTGRESGMQPDDWADNPVLSAGAEQDWRAWWAQYGDQYTPVPESGTDGDDLMYQKARTWP